MCVDGGRGDTAQVVMHIEGKGMLHREPHSHSLYQVTCLLGRAGGKGMRSNLTSTHTEGEMRRDGIRIPCFCRTLKNGNVFRFPLRTVGITTGCERER